MATKERHIPGRRLLAIIALFCMLLTVITPAFSIHAQAVTKITVSEKSLSLNKGDKVTLKIKGTTKKVVWGSYNKNIATVSSKGVVKAISAGNTTIVAVVSGSVYTCKVSVANAHTWKYKGHRYQMIDKGLKWSAAKKYCESLGGHLAVITTKGEQDALVKALKAGKGKRNNYWLGAKKNSEGKFKWVTGEKFEYDAFAGGMPDKAFEKCLMIYRYDNPNTSANDTWKWNDLVNEGTYGSESWFGLKNFGFVCEWE